MTTQVMILGASVRAAAFSARRAGYEPAAADRFADYDLRARCDVAAVTDYPRGLQRVAQQWPGLPWMYTGALENEPALVDALSRGRDLWGNPGRVLCQVRSPARVATALRDAGLDVPPFAMDVKDVPPEGTWLSKPLASCGGNAIRLLGGSVPPTTKGRYFQRRIDGVPCGAVFVAAGGRAKLLGVTRQLIGTDWAGATGFQYAGSIGPLRLPETLLASLTRIGECLANRFQLLGLFGVDAILADQTAWPVEVNPRYTASVELIERALRIDAVESHVEACRRGRLPPSHPEGDANTSCFGKAVVYANNDVTTTDRLTRSAVAANDGDWPRYADIPKTATDIRTGHPILTVFADGPNEPLVERRLRDRVETVRQWLS